MVFRFLAMTRFGGFPESNTAFRLPLFFKFGITPTANRLYQLVGKGSMTTATAVLTRFWRDLRERSQVAFAHPDIPDPLRSSAGDLIGKIWSLASQEARADLDLAKAEYEAKARDAVQHVKAAEAARDALQAEIVGLTERLLEKDASLAERDAALARLGGEYEATQRGVAKLEVELATSHSALEEAKSAFRADLESLRAAMALAEERARAGERRALAEIDAERTRAASASSAYQRELDALQKILDAKDRELLKRDDDIAVLRAAADRLEEKIAGVNAQLAAEREKFSELLARLPAVMAAPDMTRKSKVVRVRKLPTPRRFPR